MNKYQQKNKVIHLWQNDEQPDILPVINFAKKQYVSYRLGILKDFYDQGEHKIYDSIADANIIIMRPDEFTQDEIYVAIKLLDLFSSTSSDKDFVEQIVFISKDPFKSILEIHRTCQYGNIEHLLSILRYVTILFVSENIHAERYEISLLEGYDKGNSDFMVLRLQ